MRGGGGGGGEGRGGGVVEGQSAAVTGWVRTPTTTASSLTAHLQSPSKEVWDVLGRDVVLQATGTLQESAQATDSALIVQTSS